MKRTLGTDIFGLETVFHHDEHTNISTIEHKQDVQGLIDRNKSLHNTSYQRDGIKNDLCHVANIPDVVQIQWMKKYGIKDILAEEYMPLILKLLNSPEYKYLKTGNMKL